MAVMVMLGASTQVSALTYTIGFSAKGDTTAVGSVLVQNITKGTSVTVPEGSELSLNVISTGLNDLNADNAGISLAQQADGKSIVIYDAKQVGLITVEVFNMSGAKIAGQDFVAQLGLNNVELGLSAGNYVVRVSGKGYSYSAKLQSQLTSAVQASIKYLGQSTSKPLTVANKVKTGAAPQVTMDYTTGDQLKYTATAGAYKSVRTDVPVASKTFSFIYFATANIPAGTFTMGSPSTEVGRKTDEVQHQVTLSAYRMCKKEVTNSKFADFLNEMGVDEYGICEKATIFKGKVLITESNLVSAVPGDFGLHYVVDKWVPVAGFENTPVVFVTWYGASAYASYVGGALPTEAQWEYACRAGTTTTFNTGDFLTNLHANYDWSKPYNSGVNTVTVSPGKPLVGGSFAPNAFGLYDMHGNTGEFCSDWYGPYLTTAQTNPTGATTGTLRVMRGGGYTREAQTARSAVRQSASSEFTGQALSFRLVFEE